jgi:uncharacterized protein
VGKKPFQGDFYCDRCGKCCTGLGRSFIILGNPAPGQYRFRDRITGESRIVRAQAIRGRDALCPFSADGSPSSCSIYPDRPRSCREFRCYDLAVIGPDGRIIARVRDGQLKTSDQAISVLFESVQAPPGESGDAAREAWLDRLRQVFQDSGYRVCG